MIDNDEMMRILFRDTFWIHGSQENPVEVETVNSLAKARDVLAHDGAPDIIFIGLCWDGEQRGTAVRNAQPSLDFIKDLRSHEAPVHPHIIVYSKYDEQEFKDKAKEAGADEYVVKGQLTPKEIVAFVETI